MNKIKVLLFVILLLATVSSYAIHIKGGWMYYEYVRTEANGDITYNVVVKLYRDCATPTPGQNDPQIPISVVEASTNTYYIDTIFYAPQTRHYRLEKTSFSECINPKPQVCYVIIEYKGTVSLPPIPGGYILAFQRCCRIDGISNVVPPSNSFGNTYTIHLPGNDVAGGTVNSSPKFVEKDTVAICYKSPFVLDYSATDPDGDSLVYAFTGALTGGSSDEPSPRLSILPPFKQIPYSAGYSSTNPFGTNVVIDSHTGIITGISPTNTGEYVLSVSIKEYRKGKYIAETRKELHVNVAACAAPSAELPLRNTSCDDFTVEFENLSSSPSINSYYWDFGVKTSSSDTSTLPKPSYTYADTGVYAVKLVVNRNTACSDSATYQVSVFPGFFPDFQFIGSCFANPFQFNDQSITRYGFVDSWSWNFGDPTTDADTSHLKNPQYKYPSVNGYVATLLVTSNKGCADTVSKQIPVIDKPLLQLPFHDTLICSIDSLGLRAIGTGSFTWSPTNRMINSNSATPTVFPLQTTTYTVSLSDGICIATDTVRVNTLDFITVDAGNDTTICLTDSILLRPVSQALQYQWTPAAGLNDPNIKNPLAAPLNSVNTYHVIAKLGKCKAAADDVTITTVPYPLANAGEDTTICFSDTITLRGLGTGSSYQWSPANLVGSPITPITSAYPKITTPFVFKVYQSLGCPKPGVDTVMVNVIQPLQVFAGNDTSVVINQPLQLNASSNGNIYNWSPATGMNNTNILNPVILLTRSTLPDNTGFITYVLKVTTPEGCASYDDIVVRYFVTLPSIFIPNAFTPNQDGKNDDIKPILAGMKRLIFFRVYNRYGQLIFETNQQGKGWDGRFKGELQSSNAFVFDCQAEDYTGKFAELKGTFVLVR